MNSLKAQSHIVGLVMAVFLLAVAYFTESWGVAMLAVVIGGVGLATRSEG